jgi:hypothetical protein
MGEPLVLTASDMAFRQEKNRRKLAVKAVNHLIAEIQEYATSYVQVTFVEFSAQRWAEYELTRDDVKRETTKLMEALGFRVKFFTKKAEVSCINSNITPQYSAGGLFLVSGSNR